MESFVIKIVPFEESYQPEIDILFERIQEEFTEQVFPDPAATIEKLSHLPGRIYWVALANEKLVGTVGVLLLAADYCCLKSIFLSKEFRSDKRQIARQLLQTAIEYAIAKGNKMMCLGTMEQFTGAQRFYEKNGFTRTAKEGLPPDFPPNSVDTVFYMKDL